MKNCSTVEYLDTNTFSSTIEIFKNGIQEYNGIINDVKTTTDNLFLGWKGEGRIQFEKDYNVIYQQLTDIEDMMYELYQALIDAQAAYILTDEEVAKMLCI